MDSPSSTRLLVVDDEEPHLKALCDTLRDSGYETHGVVSPYAALEELRKGPGRFDLLLTDLMMPGLDGLGLLRAALESDADLVVVLMTGHGTIDTAVEAMKAGALDYILKPFKLAVILPVLERALAVSRLRRKNAELTRRVAERTVELEAANRELEAFSHSISHDLRAPLRHVDGFAKLLLGKFSAEMPAEARRHAEIIAEGAERMGQLIEDLLRFSRLSRQPLSRGPVDLAALTGSVLEELKRENPDRNLEIRLGDLPPCQGDFSLLRQVLVNLLSNAFKYTGKKEKAEIEIGSQREESGLVYFVRDNGAGFDMKYADKVFGVFQRLHKAGEFEGTGVGLSLVQRILHRHGGRVWVQAAVDEGATFYFTLPAAS
jgi:signal transduction histidine kinase